MTVNRGEAFAVGARAIRGDKFLSREIPEAGETVRRDYNNAYPWFQKGAWIWLWERKNKVAWTFWGFRFKYRRVRALWEKAFGPCPFSWKLGPNA